MAISTNTIDIKDEWTEVLNGVGIIQIQGSKVEVILSESQPDIDIKGFFYKNDGDEVSNNDGSLKVYARCKQMQGSTIAVWAAL